jgi:hypothetical protein
LVDLAIAAAAGWVANTVVVDLPLRFTIGFAVGMAPYPRSPSELLKSRLVSVTRWAAVLTIARMLRERISGVAHSTIWTWLQAVYKLYVCV